MILVVPKWILSTYYLSDKKRVQSETYRLVNTLIDGDVYAVLERLEDERPSQGHKIQKFKGDLFTLSIKDIRVIRNNDFEDQEIKREREEALKVLHIVLNGKA